RSPRGIALDGVARREADRAGSDGVDGGEQRGQRADELDVGVEPSGGVATLELARMGAGDADAFAAGVEAGAEAAFEDEAVVVELAQVAAAGDEDEMRRGGRELAEVAGAAAAAGGAARASHGAARTACTRAIREPRSDAAAVDQGHRRRRLAFVVEREAAVR